MRAHIKSQTQKMKSHTQQSDFCIDIYNIYHERHVCFSVQRGRAFTILTRIHHSKNISRLTSATKNNVFKMTSAILLRPLSSLIERQWRIPPSTSSINGLLNYWDPADRWWTDRPASRTRTQRTDIGLMRHTHTNLESTHTHTQSHTPKEVL